MPDYLFRAKDALGEVEESRIEAATLGQARYTLELRGYREIEFFTSDNDADIRRATLSGTGLAEPSAEERELTASIEIGAQGRKGILSNLAWAFGQHLVIFGPLLAWNFFSWRGERPFGWGDWTGFVATGLYLIFFGVLVLPLTIFNTLLDAAVWHDWPKQARCIAIARMLRRVMRTGIPENELLFREGNALAAQGNLSGAYARVESLRNHPDIPKYMYLSRVSSFHEYAGDFAGQLRCVQEAAAAAPETFDVWADLANVQIRHFRNVAAARAALERIADREPSELQGAAVELIEGMIAVEARDFAVAEQKLRSADTRLAKFGVPLIQSFNAELQAYLAIALCAAGGREEAQRRFATVKPLLAAQKSVELLARVEQALATGALVKA